MIPLVSGIWTGPAAFFMASTLEGAKGVPRNGGRK